MSTAKSRSAYRKNQIAPGYNGIINVASNVAICTALTLTSAWLMGWPSLTGVALLAVTTLLFNVVEYMFHRWLSHNKSVMKVYRRHVVEHHGFFEQDMMTSELVSDLHVTILPTRTIVEYYLLFLLLWVFPLAYLLGLQNACAASVGVALNILLLDVMHLYYHISEDSALSRLLSKVAYCRELKEHHRVHHNRSIMTKCNFNITHPWCDFLLGTKYKG
jgi:hypothetical protein